MNVFCFLSGKDDLSLRLLLPVIFLIEIRLKRSSSLGNLPERLVYLGVVQFGLSYVFLSRGLDAVSPVTASLTSTIEPILNPILVAVFYGETIGATAVIGALLVVGSATVYNVRQAKNAA